MKLLIFGIKEQVFDDIIRTIRTFRPDVIINRFDHRTPGRTHGHHTSSAMLSVEAFEKSNDRSIYPDQLSKLEPWQVRRQFFNTSWWFYGSREKFAEADKSRLVSLEVGAYYPTLGISNNEISGLARSKHRSQGFGSAGSRTSMQEYLELVNGDMPVNRDNIFDGINTSWTRVVNGEAIDNKMKSIFENYDFKDPSSIVPDLVDIYPLLEKLEDDYWKNHKKKQLDNIVQACLGLFIEVTTIEQQSTPADSVEIEIEVTCRSDQNIMLKSFEFNDSIYQLDKTIEAFNENQWYEPLYIPADKNFTNPYWLNEPSSPGTYKVDDPTMRNLAQSPPAFQVKFNFNINGHDISYSRDVIYLNVDPSIGEVRQAFIVIPPATIQFDKDMYLFSELNSQSIELKVRSSKDSLQGILNLDVPQNWSVEPNNIEISIPNKGMEKSYNFLLRAPEGISEAQINASIKIGEGTYNKSLTNIVYDHIPLQTVLRPASSKLVKVPLKKGGTQLAYVMGAGDKMPESLEAVGYKITLLNPMQLNTTELDRFDAVIIGIRAYNTLENLRLYNEILFDYAKRGGTLITQYNTSRRLNFDYLAPYPIKLSRKRVTDELAEMRIINPEHKVLNFPNKISSADFDGWIQERGLYFPQEWDHAYDTIWSCNDKNEDALDGSLLIAKHGDGYFVIYFYILVSSATGRCSGSLPYFCKFTRSINT